MEELKQRVIGQDEYLKDLCTTVWLQAMKKRIYEETETFYLNPKLNMLVLGKSGSGKTSTIQALASLLDLPVVVEDATMFTGTGWRGRDVASIIKDVVEVDIDPIRADYSIVVLDEIDKVFGHHTADSSFYAANNFLKMMEGTFLNYEEGGKHYQMDTSNLLFICLGKRLFVLNLYALNSNICKGRDDNVFCFCFCFDGKAIPLHTISPIFLLKAVSS